MSAPCFTTHNVGLFASSSRHAWLSDSAPRHLCVCKSAGILAQRFWCKFSVCVLCSVRGLVGVLSRLVGLACLSASLEQLAGPDPSPPGKWGCAALWGGEACRALGWIGRPATRGHRIGPTGIQGYSGRYLTAGRRSVHRAQRPGPRSQVTGIVGHRTRTRAPIGR